MKARHRLLPLLVISATFASASTNQYWNVGGTGGNGIWGTGPGDKNWNLTADGSVANTTWPDPTDHVAVFQDALGGSVTVFDPVQTHGISQTGANYTLDAGVITLVTDASAAAPFLNVQTGTLTVNSVLAGTAGLAKTGPGTLVLSNANTFTGTTAIHAGTLNLTGSLASTDVRIASGGSLTDAGGGLATGTVLTNSGTLALGENDTVASYISNGGTLAAGIRTLNVTSANLNDGSSVAGYLNGPTLTTNGAVSISGNTYCQTTNIASGTLTLTGTLGYAFLNIAPGATLEDQSGGLSSRINVTNAGTLAVNAAQSIESYIQSSTGSLTGTAVLTVNDNVTPGVGITLNGGTVAGNLRGNTISTGDVLVSGTLGGGSLDVTGGTLNLTGTATNTRINIAAAGKLIDAADGLDAGATIHNSGMVTIDAADQVASYTQNGTGSLAGTGVLTVTAGAILNGGTISGKLNGNTTSTGQTLVSGTLDGGSLDVTGGTLTLTGTLSSPIANIASGAWLKDYSGGLADTTTVTNGGLLIMGAADSVATYQSSGALIGPEILSTTSASLANGARIFGNLQTTTLSTNGHVTITGTVIADSTRIATGTLRMATERWGIVVPPGFVFDGATMSGDESPGLLNSATVEIASGATLSDLSGGLADTTILTNAGTLELGADDTTANYISNGGTLSGNLHLPTSLPNIDFSSAAMAQSEAVRVDVDWLISSPEDSIEFEPVLINPILPTLTTTTATLNDGSVVSGGLDAGTLTTTGVISITGSARANSFNIASRILTNTGTLTANRLNIGAGATLGASGTQSYNLITTSGTSAGTWQGDLTNPTTVAPGGLGGIGILRVTGNFTNAPTGTLTLDVGAGGSDMLEVGGTATFGGTLALSQLGAPIPAFVPVTVVTAAGYAGNFTALTEDLDGAVWFNPVNGSVTRIQPPTGGAAFGATPNQGAVWTALYDDVIDPGYTNITLGADGLPIVTSGVASGANPDLLWALAASFTPTGLNAAVLDRLSPEVYTGLSDYAVQATRAHQRTALDAPTLAPVVRPQTADSKGGSKAAAVANHGSVQWDLFGAIDHFNVISDSSANLADYELDGTGFIAGVRGDLTDRLRLAGYAAGNTGTVTGPLLDADATGFSLGLLGELLLNERFGTRLTAGLSYGTYEFDGSRGSVVATAGGWQPGRAGFSNVESDAVELFIGVETVAWHNDRFRLIPAIGLRQAWSTLDSIAEDASAPGGPIALTVAEDSHAATLAEISLLAEADLTAQLTLRGIAGFNAGLGDDPHALKATLSPGGRPFGVTADGLTGDAFFLGVGAEYLITESIRVGLNYRADFRDDADVQQVVGLSSTFRF